MNANVLINTDRKTNAQLVAEFELLINDMEERAHHIGRNEIENINRENITNIEYLNKLKYHIKVMKDIKNILTSTSKDVNNDTIETKVQTIFREAKQLYNKPIPTYK